eukprot:scaffold53455_cov68-Phaeocystis_antarctica.AAC.2
MAIAPAYRVRGRVTTRVGVGVRVKARVRARVRDRVRVRVRVRARARVRVGLGLGLGMAIAPGKGRKCFPCSVRLRGSLPPVPPWREEPSPIQSLASPASPPPARSAEMSRPIGAAKSSVGARPAT